MMDPILIESIENSVLCWLATSTSKGEPNVSPKEVFTHYGENNIIIANIASPNSVKNIKANKKVCVSFIDIFIQKGFQIKGDACILDKESSEYKDIEKELIKITKGAFPFKTVTKIAITHVKPIVAPRYLLYPETSEQDQIISARKTYGID